MIRNESLGHLPVHTTPELCVKKKKKKKKKEEEEEEA